MGYVLQVAHSDGVTLRVSTSAVSFAVSKAFLRRRERELIRQKEAYNERWLSMPYDIDQGTV